MSFLGRRKQRAPEPSTTDFEKAKSLPDAYAILEGDYTGQCYLTVPMRIVNCQEKELVQLLYDVDEICWSEIEGTRLTYAQHKPGDLIDSGMDGGLTQEGLWMHKDIIELGLESRIRSVLSGQASRLGSPEELARWRAALLSYLRASQHN